MGGGLCGASISRSRRSSRLTVLSRLRHLRGIGEGVFVHLQLREDARAFLEEERFAVLATVNANGSPQQTVVC
jgi:hypothetical protein